MKKMVALSLIMPFLALGLCGCVPVLLMAVGGIGVYAVSKDTIQADTETSYEAIWDASVKISRTKGAVLQEDFNRGYIEIDARPNKIWIQLIRVSANATKIRVSARKYKLPNIELAQQVFTRIFEESKRLD